PAAPSATTSQSANNSTSASRRNHTGLIAIALARARVDSTCTRISLPRSYPCLSVSEFSQELIERSGYMNEGFADLYDRFRPSPPDEVLDILSWLARAERPRLVVDLGSGTGLGTRAWGTRAEEVVGVEPNPRMIERARAAPA